MSGKKTPQVAARVPVSEPLPKWTGSLRSLDGHSAIDPKQFGGDRMKPMGSGSRPTQHLFKTFSD